MCTSIFFYQSTFHRSVHRFRDTRVRYLKKNKIDISGAAIFLVRVKKTKIRSLENKSTLTALSDHSHKDH